MSEGRRTYNDIEIYWHTQGDCPFLFISDYASWGERCRYKELMGLDDECHYDEDPDSCPLRGCVVTVRHLPDPKEGEA
jgi:hypothetical protein